MIKKENISQSIISGKKQLQKTFESNDFKKNKIFCLTAMRGNNLTETSEFERLKKYKIDYTQENPFSTPDTNILAQISSLSKGKTILDYI